MTEEEMTIWKQGCEEGYKAAKDDFDIHHVYLAIIYVNDCLDDILVFRTYEAAERFRKEKDHFHPYCEIKVGIIRQEIQ